MEKWSYYLGYLQSGKGFLVIRVALALLLLPWYMFCAVIKILLYFCVLMGSVLYTFAHLWMKLIGAVVVIFTILQMTGNCGNTPFWLVDSPMSLTLQILGFPLIAFLPVFITETIAGSGLAFIELIEEFNVWVLKKLS